MKRDFISSSNLVLHSLDGAKKLCPHIGRLPVNVIVTLAMEVRTITEMLAEVKE